MSDRTLRDLLGTGDRDPGCEGAFEQFDQYCDAVRGGEDVSLRFREFITHIQNCAACREDTEGLLAALEKLEE